MKEEDLKIGQLYKVDKSFIEARNWYKFYIYRNEIYELTDIAIRSVLLMKKNEPPIRVIKEDFLNHYTPYLIPINNINKDTAIKGIITSKENIIKKVEQDLEKALEDFQKEIEKEVNKEHFEKPNYTPYNDVILFVTSFLSFIAFGMLMYHIESIIVIIGCFLSLLALIYSCIKIIF